MNEAALYLRNHDALCRLYHRDAAGQALARRLLEISRGHPLILDRLATLANDPAALAQTLDSLQDGSGWQNLSDIFAAKSETDRADERVYLEDITIGAIDLLIQRTSSNARRLLWMIALADEPVSLALIEAFWAGESVELEDVEKMRNSLAEILPEDQRKKFEDLLATEGGQHHLKPLYEMFFPAVPPVRPLLDELHGAGLLSREEESSYTSHELVRERIVRWMEDHPDDTAGHSQKEVWYAYGHRYAMTCEQLQTSRQDGAMEKATEAGRRALIYLARASAIDLFAAIGSSMITNTQNPAALQSAIKEIRAIIEQVPPGKSHWLILLNLADALCNIDQLDEALPLYEQAAKEAEGDEDWKDLAVICHNWAGGLRNSGDLCQAKTTFLRGAEVAKKAGMPRIHILFDELSALRIYVTQGEVATSMPEIEWRLDEVRSLWQQYIAGERASEAIDPVILARTFSSALETAGYANKISENWERCLSLLLEAEQLGRDLGKGGVELAQTRFNQFPSLLKLGRLDEAQLVVESCLDEFITKQHTQGQVMALGALAHIWRERGEISKAIDLSRQVLLLYNSYSDPIDRARSHCNLAWYLGETGNLHEAARHQLADIIYCHVSGHRQSLMSAIANLIEFNTRATQAGHRYKLPRLADLLADPEFNALKQFLTSRNIDFDDLQASIDAYN